MGQAERVGDQAGNAYETMVRYSEELASSYGSLADLVDLSITYNKAGDFFTATNDLDRAEVVFGSSVKVMHQVAASKTYRECGETLRQYLRIAPGTTQFRRELAGVHERLGFVYWCARDRTDEAIRELTTSLKMRREVACPS